MNKNLYFSAGLADSLYIKILSGKYEKYLILLEATKSRNFKNLTQKDTSRLITSSMQKVHTFIAATKENIEISISTCIE